ncbi:MAG: phenylacetic acid degradation operon negative regulatory protein PaaX [Chloroflexi bacterium]|nr:phenylacetic acid degradation operon negative regulatory protein PaaX [Chloroflexota bacterium]
MKNGSLRPQSLIFTLFGDYIRHRGDRVWIGSLVKLLALFDVAEPAVRSTVSRMTRRGWLKNERIENTSYYFTTPKAQQVIEEGAQRIFHFPERDGKWDGNWHLVTYSIPEEKREARDNFRRELSWLGYGMLTNAMWISPHNQRERIEVLAATLNVKPFVQIFSGHPEGFTPCSELAARCWNLAAINAEYAAFIEKYAARCADFERRVAAGARIEPSEYFAQRFMLTHEYRRFPFADPHLPDELLPGDWRGADAAALFQKFHNLLADGANKYFESVYR